MTVDAEAHPFLDRAEEFGSQRLRAIRVYFQLTFQAGHRSPFNTLVRALYSGETANAMRT